MAEVDVPKEVDSGTSSEKDTEKKLSADAFQNFIQGKRHMLVQDYANAVASLADACELYVEHFGQTATECAEVYFHYGKALFRLFQQQVGIIGNLVSDESSNEEAENSDSEEDKEKENTDDNENENENEEGENDEEENDEEDLGEDDDASKDAAEGGGKSDSTAEAEKVENCVEKGSSSETATASSGDMEITTEATTSEADESKEPVTNLDEPGPSTSRPKTEEEISDLQLAWETLETAKSIFKRQGDDCRDSQLKVAEILLILAEISMELENYSAAIDDLWECLKTREQYLEPDDRLIAETYYQMGLGHTFAGQVDLALQNYQKSIDCIMLRISNLKKQTVIQKTPEGFDINPAEEITELEAILPDIKAKMEDTQDMVQDTKNLMKELVFQNTEECAASSSTDKPATNITHLLKRKKPEDQPVANQAPSKKVKLNSTPVEEEQMKPDSSTSDSVPNA